MRWKTSHLRIVRKMNKKKGPHDTFLKKILLKNPRNFTVQARVSRKSSRVNSSNAFKKKFTLRNRTGQMFEQQSLRSNGTSRLKIHRLPCRVETAPNALVLPLQDNCILKFSYNTRAQNTLSSFQPAIFFIREK